MRRTIAHTKLMMAAALAVAALGSCTRGENVYDDQAYYKSQAQLYAKSWVEKFGAIDPNQNWNMATQVKSTISVPSNSTVNVYTGNPYLNQGILLGTFTQSGEYTFDAPKGRNALYYELVKNDGTKEMHISIMENGVFNMGVSNSSYAKTRGSDGCNTSVGSSFTIEYEPYQDPSDNSWKNKSATFYSLNNVATSVGSEWKVSDFLGILQEKNGEDGVFKEGNNNVSKWRSSLNFDVVYEMASSGPVTLDLNFRNTSGNDKIGYFYYTGTLDINNVKKYILIDNAAESSLIKKNEYQTWSSGYSGSWSDAAQQMNIQYDNENTIYRGTRYNLVYFGSDGTSEGTYTFPQGTKIGFFIIQDNYYSGNNLVKYSIPSLNDSSENGQEYASTFNYGGTTFLGFEDWRNGDYDLNDVMFFATGNFTPPTEIGPEPEETPQWIIACEDLGDTDDYDFNDIVFSVTHLAGSDVATITPWAAGGVYEANIYYKGEFIGEIHEMLGHSAKADGTYPMINTGGTKSTKQEKGIISVPTDYSVAEDMAGFSIEVVIPGDGNAQQAVRIYGTTPGTAPQMFLVEGTWKWPKERRGIELAYPDFRNWNGNASNTSWCNSYDSDEIVWDKK